MRLFTAIDIPPEVQGQLERFVAPLRPLAQLSWSSVVNLHITTLFIGEWPEARLGEMKRALAEVPRKGEFEISVRGVGWFPNQESPHTFWAGVDGGAQLHALAEATSRALVGLGIPLEERHYAPHLTLGRIRKSTQAKNSLGPLRKAVQAASKQAVQAASKEDGLEFGTFRARQFFLYLSAGGNYTQLERFPLD